MAVAAIRVDAPFGKCKIEMPEFGEREFRVSEFGAKADGMKCTEAFAAAMETGSHDHLLDEGPGDDDPRESSEDHFAVRGTVRC